MVFCNNFWFFESYCGLYKTYKVVILKEPPVTTLRGAKVVIDAYSVAHSLVGTSAITFEEPNFLRTMFRSDNCGNVLQKGLERGFYGLDRFSQIFLLFYVPKNP